MDGVKRRLAHIGSSDTEREQAMIRVAIGAILLGFYTWIPIHLGRTIRTPDTGTLVLLFFATVALLVHVLVYPGVKPWRRLAGATLDISSITYFHFASDAAAVPMYALYLWIIFGNGFRYGQRYLHFALGLSLVGFGTAMLSLPQWRANPPLAWGLWVGMLAVSLYVSHLSTRLRTAVRVAEAANMAKRSFVSSVSHELRTPLSSIVCMGSLLRLTELDDEQQDILSSLEDASRQMLTLIEDVLDFSKIEAGKIALDLVDFKVSDLMESATGLMRAQAQGKGLELKCSLAPNIPSILHGDHQHLKQVLVNLVSNAVKFTHLGEVSCGVTLLREEEKQIWLRFEVSDTGIGIPVSAQARIFESFVQADSTTTRSYGGTGLGTTIAKQLVELMGGQIGLVSTPGKGSLFWFELPLSCPGPALKGAENEVRSAVETSVESLERRTPISRSLRILVAEDNGTNAKLLRRVLDRAGHTHEFVQDGEQALDRLATRQFDVALFDMNMPVMSGLEAVKAYRYVESRGRRIPIAMFSADASIESKQECLLAGASAYLTKPIQLAQLLNTLEQLTNTVPASSPKVVESCRRLSSSTDDLTSSSAPLDLAALEDLEAMGGSPDFLKSLVGDYIEDTRQLIQRLESAMNRQRLHECREVLHAMKGSAVSLGAVGMRHFCEELEAMDPKDLFREGRSNIERCDATFEALCFELKRCGKYETRIANDGDGRPATWST